MSTTANIVIKYEDRKIGAPSELWLFHGRDGNVQGIGETVVRAVHAYGRYVDNGNGLQRLWDTFPEEFENASGMADDIEFLYQITYADNEVSVIARHDGCLDQGAGTQYHPTNDAPENSVELYSAKYTGHFKHLASFQYDIHEPESYIRTLPEVSQSAARAWEGQLRW